jgi:hypothetical protein
LSYCGALADSLAQAQLRAARAERLEDELLLGLAETGRGLAAALHADRDARATLALLHRYRRDAEVDTRRALESLHRLHLARSEDLIPEAELADRLNELPAPIEPRIEKIEPLQRVTPAEPAAAVTAAPRRRLRPSSSPTTASRPASARSGRWPAGPG